MVEIPRLVLGAFLNIQMWCMLTLNILALSCIIKSRLYAKKDSSVYILAGFNIACEACQLLMHALYMGPAILAESWLFGGQDTLGVTVISTIFLGLWYLGGLMQILFATNRFVVICFPGRVFFTRNRVILFIAVCCCAATAMVVYSQLLSPCCRITLDPFVYSYSYLVFPNTTGNPSMFFVDLPLDSFASLYCGVSYLVLFAYVHRVGAADKSARRRELKYCVQFLLMFLTYTVAWLTFFLYPALGIRQREAYSVTIILFFLNCGTNSIIYLVLNNEVRCAANGLLDRNVFKVQNKSGNVTQLSRRTINE